MEFCFFVRPLCRGRPLFAPLKRNEKKRKKARTSRIKRRPHSGAADWSAAPKGQGRGWGWPWGWVGGRWHNGVLMNGPRSVAGRWLVQSSVVGAILFSFYFRWGGAGGFHLSFSVVLSFVFFPSNWQLRRSWWQRGVFDETTRSLGGGPAYLLIITRHDNTHTRSFFVVVVGL